MDYIPLYIIYATTGYILKILRAELIKLFETTVTVMKEMMKGEPRNSKDCIESANKQKISLASSFLPRLTSVIQQK